MIVAYIAHPIGGDVENNLNKISQGMQKEILVAQENKIRIKAMTPETLKALIP